MSTDFKGSIDAETFLIDRMGKNWRDACRADTIIERLVMVRKAMNMSMAELARQLDIPKQRVNDYEKGHRVPPIKTLIEWSDALDMDTPTIIFAFMMEQVKEAGIDPEIIIRQIRAD